MPDAEPLRPTWTGAVGFFSNWILGLLVFLSVSTLQGTDAPLAGPVQPRADWDADFPERVERVTAALSQLPLPLPTPSIVLQGAGTAHWSHRRYEATVPKPPQSLPLVRLFAPLRAAAPGVTVGVREETPGITKVQIGVDGLLTHSITLHWLERRPQVAFIVDGLGSNLLIARAFAGIDAPLTFAVSPFEPFSKEVAELAALFHREVWLRLAPQEENKDGGNTAAPSKSDRPAFLRWLGRHISAVPHAVGIYGRFGPSSGPNLGRVQWLLAEAKEKGLLVLDAGDPAESSTCELAASLPVACAHSPVLLGDSDDEQEMRNQLEAALDLARTRGQAIAVGHATPSTVAVLQAAVPTASAAGIDLVPASTIIGQRSLSVR